MLGLQQFEEAEERVHAWHAEMAHCMELQQAQERIARRSWLAALGHCLGYVGGWHVRKDQDEAYAEDEGVSPASVSPIRSSRS